MARRGGTTRFRCAQEGCTEHAFYEYTSQRDYERLTRSQRERPWRCQRHLHPNEVLSAENATVSTVWVATPGEGNIAQHLFWHDGARLGSGFASGPGFKAFAKDFPPGTRLVITATIEPPIEPDDQAEATEGTAAL